MKKSVLLAATALTAHAAFAQAPSSTASPTPQTDLAALAPTSTTSSSSGTPSGSSSSGAPSSSSSGSPSASSSSGTPSTGSTTAGTTAAASPTMTTTATSAGGCQTPAPAASAGYNQMTYGPDMVLGANWHPGDNVTSGLTQNSDGSISIRGGDGNNYNKQLSSGSAQFGGGAYVQATLSFQNPTVGWYQGVDGWPAFWGWATDPSGHVIEPDFFEFMTAGNNQEFDSNIHDWGATGQNASEGGKATLPSGFDASQPHTYGWLWVPASGSSQGSSSMFVDGQQVGPTHTWSPGGPYSTMDASKLEVIFGTGAENPMTVYNTQVWQKDASQDVGIVGTSAGNNGGACPTVVSANSPTSSTPSGGGSSPPSGGAGSSNGPSTRGHSTGSSLSNSSGITPQTNLQAATNMGTPAAGEWGSFSVGGKNYEVTVVDPPGNGSAYEVLIADGGTPYILELPQGVGGGTASSSPGGMSGSGLGSGALSSQLGNPGSTSMTATPAGATSSTGAGSSSYGSPSGITTTTGPNGEQITTVNQSSTNGTPLNATISNQTGSGSGSSASGSGSGSGSGAANDESGAEDDAAGGGGSGPANQSATAGSGSTGSGQSQRSSRSSSRSASGNTSNSSTGNSAGANTPSSSSGNAATTPSVGSGTSPTDPAASSTIASSSGASGNTGGTTTTTGP